MDTNLPQEFLLRMKEILGDSYDDYLLSMKAEAVKGAHINRCKVSSGNTDTEKVFPCKVSTLSWYSDGFLCSDADHIGQSAYHHAGTFYVQEPSAMAPVCCLDIKPGMKVLDMCSAPGGKSSQIANRLAGTGILVANEYVSSRTRILASNLERMGTLSCMITNCDCSVFAENLVQFFDAVVVDAPCSGEGMFRKDSEAVGCWTPQLPVTCAERQGKLLDYASVTVNVGGQLLYSTCTFSLEEDEMTVCAFLDRHPDFELVMLPKEILDITARGINFPGCSYDMSYTGRFYPHISSGEGQFMALFRRKTALSLAPSKATNRKEKRRSENDRLYVPSAFLPDKKSKEIIDSFLSDTLICANPPKAYMFKDGITLDAPPVPLPLSAIYATGVKLGEIRSGRIVPHHAFFSAYGEFFRRKIDLADKTPALDAYLRGETFECSCENGWAVVTIDGIPLGGVKVIDGIAKNHYPSGLRRK